jgi:hypothetical protein
VGARQTFRSPFAVAIWWLWVLFAVGNLVDLAVQGRDHLSVVAGFILVLVTGVVYVTAQRPRILAGDDLTFVNPLRDHRIGWAAVSRVEATDLVRVRCEWPIGDDTHESGTGESGTGEPGTGEPGTSEPGTGEPGTSEPGTGEPAMRQRLIYSWAVQTTRRRQISAQIRSERRRPAQRTRSVGGFGARPEPEPDPPTIGDVSHVVAALSACAEQAQAANPGQRAEPPVSTWYWPAFAAILVPALALVIAILA